MVQLRFPVQEGASVGLIHLDRAVPETLDVGMGTRYECEWRGGPQKPARAPDPG